MSHLQRQLSGRDEILRSLWQDVVETSLYTAGGVLIFGDAMESVPRAVATGFSPWLESSFQHTDPVATALGTDLDPQTKTVPSGELT